VQALHYDNRGNRTGVRSLQRAWDTHQPIDRLGSGHANPGPRPGPRWPHLDRIRPARDLGRRAVPHRLPDGTRTLGQGAISAPWPLPGARRRNSTRPCCKAPCGCTS